MSCNVANMLTSVCQQIAANYDLDAEEIPEDFSALVTHFKSILQVFSD
jgi:hypothetical protein